MLYVKYSMCFSMSDDNLSCFIGILNCKMSPFFGMCFFNFYIFLNCGLAVAFLHLISGAVSLAIFNLLISVFCTIFQNNVPKFNDGIKSVI